MSYSHKLVRNNPLLPYWCPVPGRGFYHLQFPHTLKSAKAFLTFISRTDPATIMRQCKVCHRYITGAPHPDVDHHASPPGQGLCFLPHHPLPCPFKDEHDNPCTFEPEALLGPLAPVLDAELTLVQQLEQLRREKEEETRRANGLQLANANLKESQAKLSQENLNLRQTVVPSVSSFTPTTTTSSQSLSISRASMGVGYSSSFGATTPSVAGGSIPSSMVGAAQNLASLNMQHQQQLPHAIRNYGGPTIPDLRSNQQVSAVAQEVLGLLLREIPSLAPQQSSLYSSAPPPSSSLPLYPVPGASSPYIQQPVFSAVPPTIPVSVYPAPPAVPRPSPAYQQSQIQPAFGTPQSHPLIGAPSAPPLLDLQGQLSHQQPQYQELSRSQVSIPQIERQQVNSDVSLESLLSATVVNKQYFAIDFAKLSSFPYISNLKSSNLNLSLFSYGSIKHLLSLSNGTLAPVSKTEFNNRIQHILNVLEIVCLGSGLTDFDSHSWRVAREYDVKIVKDVEQGFKCWQTLNKCIYSTAWTYACQLVPQKPKNEQNSSKNQQNSTQKLCTTFNTFRNGNGCSFEYNNPGQNCVFTHSCSKCRQKGFPDRRHKAINCRQEPEPQNTNSSSNVTSNTISSLPPVVTSV